MTATTSTDTYRRPAPAEPAERAYVSNYEPGVKMLEAGNVGLGAYRRTGWARKGWDGHDPAKAYVASSWIFAPGTPEHAEHTGRYFRTPKAAQEWIRSVAAAHGFLTADAQIAR